MELSLLGRIVNEIGKGGQEARVTSGRIKHIWKLIHG